MDSLYSAAQPYGMYEPHQWTDDSKSNFVGDEHNPALDDKGLASIHTINTGSASDSRRSSMLKVEDEFAASATPTAVSSSQIWHDRSHDSHPVRSFSTSHTQMMSSIGQPFSMRANDPAFTNGLPHANTWSVPQSGTNTPTPLYSQAYGMQFNHAPSGFATYAQDPISAVSMSPQSSQGGWASTTSSDGIDQRGMISPTYRPTSPGTVVRPDGIRKKNARFEIPKERNLANIDALILASTDETEKKELKQQKRLLRNRQAALDSRQRKKTHTEKLEQEKKMSEKKMFDLEEALTRLENTLALEREQYMQQRQHLENVIHALRYDLDEALRSKTLETADLRRQNNALTEYAKDLEREQHKGYAPASHTDNYDTDYGFELENRWDDDEFNFIEHDDSKMDDQDALHAQTTPKPTPVTSKPVDTKAEAGFSWNTVYMCLLFGAFIASNSNNTSNMENNAASAFASSIPSTEASNVVKSVLSSRGVPADLLPGRSESATYNSAVGMDAMHPIELDNNGGPSSDLDHLHQSLSTPSRRQEMAAAFSMSASSYQHLTDPFNEHLDLGSGIDILEPAAPPQPSALQKAYASMQAHKDNLDKITGMGSKARERSLIWDRVPPEVIKNFEAMIQQSAKSNSNSNSNNNAERMEQ